MPTYLVAGPPRWIITQADQTRNSASPALANDAYFVWGTIQPGLYVLRVLLQFNSNPGQLQIQLNCGTPGTKPSIWSWNPQTGAAQQSKGLNVTVTDAAAANTSTAELRGLLDLSAATTMQILWTNNVASSATTIFRGSSAELQQLSFPI